MSSEVSNLTSSTRIATITATPKADGTAGNSKTFTITAAPSKTSFLTVSTWTIVKIETFEDGVLQDTITDEAIQHNYDADGHFETINHEGTFTGTWFFASSETIINHNYDGYSDTVEVVSLTADEFVYQTNIDDGWTTVFTFEH